MKSVNEIRAEARNATVSAISDTLFTIGAIQVGDATFAIPQTVDGATIWTEVVVKSKNFKDTDARTAYNPQATREEWEADKAFRKEQRMKKAAAKAADAERRAAEASAEGE